ncbi:MAG: HIT family protein [Candidatus Falkowbacteria bacterium]
MAVEICRYCSKQYQNSVRVVLFNDYWFGVFDNHPVSLGRMKLVSKNHKISFEDLSDEEVIAFRDILKEASFLINERHRPDGWNIGYNNGITAGQTVFHLHVHVIPRYKGDVEDPTGGIRTILSGGNYKKGE